MKIKMLTLFLVVLLSCGAAQAVDSVAIFLYNVTDGVYVNSGETIYTTNLDGTDTFQYRVEMWLENDIALGGMSLGLTFSGDDQFDFNWEPQVGGFGPTGVPDWAITVESGSDFDPAQGGTGTFDMTGLLVTARDVDSIAPDSCLLGGVSLWNSLATGSLRHIFNFNFSLGLPGATSVEFTIDSGKVGPSGDFVYTNATGQNSVPKFCDAITVTIASPSAVGDGSPAVAYAFALDQNYPNPFNPTTKISYSLARKSEVNIAIFNILGQKVNTLVSTEQNAGPYEVVWNGDNEDGSKVASGIYFYKMVTDEYVETRKMVLMR